MSQIYSHPTLGYRCFENANRSTGSYLACSDLETKQPRWVTYIWDGYYEGHYLVQTAAKVASNPFNQENKWWLSNNDNEQYTIDRKYPNKSWCSNAS